MNMNTRTLGNNLKCFLFIPFTQLVLTSNIYNINKNNAMTNDYYPNLFCVKVLFLGLLYGYLSIVLSDKIYTGRPNVDGSIPKYAGNGFKFWYRTVILTILFSLNFQDFPTLFVSNFMPYILTSNIFSLIFVNYLYLRDRDNYHDRENDERLGYNYIFKFYRGLRFHPEFMMVDVKQWTNCRFGMISWQIIILLFYFHYNFNKGFNLALFLTVMQQSLYIGKFFYWELGYFNTLDITLDRGGYYICWGCLVFVPGFYTSTTYYLINNTINIDYMEGLIISSFGLYFLYMNYIVDKQKQDFKERQESMKIDHRLCKYMAVKYFVNNEERDGKLLIDGYWSTVRHLNYTYEILLSLCWSLVCYKYDIIPFFYVIYITIILIHRIYRDERKCQEKYGKYWDKYCKVVKYRLIKYVY